MHRISSQLWMLLVWLFTLSPLPAESPQPVLPSVFLTAGKVRLLVEVAKTPQEQARGLMFRQSLPPNVGMIFLFEAEKEASFWMANTLIPLSIAYLDRTGKILEIHDMIPLNQTSVPSKSRSVACALEVNQGWFTEQHLRPGDRITPAEGSWDDLRRKFQVPLRKP